MYRDPYYAANCRERRDDGALPPELATLSAHQLARVVAGLVGLVAFATVVVGAITGHWPNRLPARPISLPCFGVEVILLAWPAMGVGGLLAYWMRSLWPARRRSGSAGDVLTAALRDTANAATRAHIDRVARGELRSFALLAVAVALLAPLTIHILFISLVSGTFRPSELDPYLVFALATVWLPHLVVGGLSWHFVAEAHAQLDLGAAALHPPRPILSGVRAACLAAASTLLSAIFVACAAGGPFLLIVLITGGLVVITGLAYLPLGYWLLLRRLRVERARLRCLTPPPIAADVLGIDVPATDAAEVGAVEVQKKP